MSDRANQHEHRFGRALRPFLERGHYDVVHSMTPRDASAAVRTRGRGGHVVVYDEMGIPDPAFWRTVPDGPARRKLVEDVDVYGCMSQCALDSLRDLCGREGVLIPGGVRIDEFSIGEREPSPTVLFSGTLEEQRKGVPVLVDAVVRLLDRRPDLKLWLSGPGNSELMRLYAPPAARDAIVGLPLGEVTEQAERYRRAWVTALPSTHESFGMVLIESLASGTPITVCRHGAPPELARPGVGTIAEPWNSGSLAGALDEALELHDDPGLAARCRASAEPYDWDGGIAPLLERVYLDAIEGRG